jgi:hypothetical protein
LTPTKAAFEPPPPIMGEWVLGFTVILIALVAIATVRLVNEPNAWPQFPLLVGGSLSCDSDAVRRVNPGWHPGHASAPPDPAWAQFPTSRVYRDDGPPEGVARSCYRYSLK